MFFYGMLAAAAIAAFVVWVVKKDIKMTWYEWLLGALAILFSMMAVQHYTGSLVEYETKSAWMGALIFGVIAIVLYAIATFLILRHNRSAA